MKENKKDKIIKDPRYASYPQEFRSFWKDHVIKGGMIAVGLVIFALLLAYFYQFPSDTNMPPMPDEGAFIPGPEWYQMVLFQTFWYITGDHPFLKQLFNFWVPLVVFSLIFLVPFLMKKRDSKKEDTQGKDSKDKDSKEAGSISFKKLIPLISVGAIVLVSTYGLIGSGGQAKIIGCSSCHNPMMGVRQALPPPDMADFYRTSRKQQIAVGKYRAGKTVDASGMLVIGAVQSYKDANWQLRHMYEPTLTW